MKRSFIALAMVVVTLSACGQFASSRCYTYDVAKERNGFAPGVVMRDVSDANG